MIKGSTRPFDFRFDTDFNDFLNSVKRASVTYKVDPLTVNGKIEDSPDIRFNLQRTPEKYVENLEKEFNASCNEIENQLNSTFLKSEKLYQLTRYTIEIESIQKLLTNGPEGFVHKKFSFSDISKAEKYNAVTLYQHEFQEYYYWMDHYLQKMHHFLTQMRSLTEIIQQSEFQIPSSMLPDPNGSSVERPLAFFEYLLLRNGIADLRRAFMPSEDDYNSGPPMQYDKKTETITYYDQNYETGEPEISTSSFEKILLNRTYKEFIETKRLINEHVNSLGSEQDIKLFFLRTMSSLRYFLKVIVTNKELKKYNSNEQAIKALIRYCYDRYDPFLPAQKEEEFFKGILSYDAKTHATIGATAITQNMLPQKELVYAFKWTKNQNELTSKLYYALTEGGFISTTVSLIHFSKAFAGATLDNALGICWLKTVRGKLSKPLILYLFDQLMENGLLEKETNNNQIFKKIRRIFFDHLGKPLKYMNVSSAQIKNRTTSYTKQEKEVNAIIAELIE